MEVKEILEKIRQRETKPPEYFLALLLDEGLVKSAIWQVTEGTVEVLSLGAGQSWEKEEEILGAVDASIPETTPEPKKIIFGLPPEWIEDNKIAAGKLEILKKISAQLELSPVGFVVITEAITYQLKITEGVPPTAILVGLTSQNLRVTLIKLGRIVGSQKVSRSDSLGADLSEGLSRFGPQEIFPARILLYNSRESLEEAREKLMDYSWPKEINFLHLPRIEVLPADCDIRAIVLAGGREVTQIEGIGIGPSAEEKKVTEEEMTGFLKEGDITKEALAIPPEKPKPQIPRFPALRFPSFPSGIRLDFLGGAIVAGLIILGGALAAGWWYFPRAEVTLLIEPQLLEKDFTVKFDPSLTIADKETFALPGRPFKVVIDGEKTGPVTGTKIIGDRASGEVTIYNRTAKSKTFDAGTQILGPGNLKFSLEGAVTVASESAGPDYTSIPGKAKVKIKAVDIGTESNLASSTEFGIDNFSRSDFIARNEEAFSGGTSREVTVVAKKDQEDLLSKLNEELENKANEELFKTTPTDKKIIPESLTSVIIEKKFNPEINQEATELKLSLKAEFAVLTYNPQELQVIIRDKVRELIPSGFEYREENSETSFDFSKSTLHLKARLVPQLDLEKIKKDLIGKSPDLAQQYLTNLANIEGAEIKIRPSWLGPLATLPHVSKNIKIEIKVE